MNKKEYWENKGKKKEIDYAECPTCKSKIYHENIVSIIKCNICGYQKPIIRSQNE